MQAKAREVYVPPVLQDLRAGTAELHIALEKRLPFFSDTLDIPSFERLMAAYHGFYFPLENALQRSGSVPDDFDLTPRLKTSTLRGDLQALGLAPLRWKTCRSAISLPVIDSSAAFLGVLYVLEGATLGGQILRREISAPLALKQTTALPSSMSMALPPAVAGANLSNTWAIARWTPMSAKPL